MDESSVLRGFQATFGIDCEEVAIRFYRLFLIPPSQTADKQKMKRVDLLQFFETVLKLTDRSNYGESLIQKAFKFYDYDEDGAIGSVDIVNLLRHLDQKKMEKVFRKQSQLHQAR